MKRLLTILLLAISGLASAQTYQLNYPDIRIGNSNTGKIVLRGSNVQFPFLGLGSITDSVVTIVGGVFKKVPRSQFSGGGSSGVSSFNGRTGAVSPLSADYNAFYPLLASTYNNPSWINTLAYSKITGVPAFITTETDPVWSGVASTYRTKTQNDALYYPLGSNPANYLTSVPAQSFASLTGKPTTLSGYGITDAYPLTGNPSGFITSYTETDPTVPAYAKTLTAFSVIKPSTDALYEPIISPKNTAFNKIAGYGLSVSASTLLVDSAKISTKYYVKNVSDSNKVYTNVKSFGAKGDGVTDDRTSIQACLDFITSKGGGAIYFPYGKYQISATLQVNSQILFVGDGSSSYEWNPSYGVNNNGSVIQINSTNSDAVLVNVSGVSFQNIGINNTSVTTPTAGTGIKYLTAGSFNLHNVSIKNFYNGIDIKDGTRWSIEACNIFFPINYGIYIHSNTNSITADTGDNSIVGTSIIADKNGITGIKYESSGGLKIVNSKINPSNSARVKIGIDLESKGNTSILLIDNSSFEGFSENAIKIRSDGTHNFDKIKISGNQIESYSDAVNYINIQGSNELIRNVIITDNIIQRGTNDGSSTAPIIINDIVQADLSGNQYRNFNNRTLITSTPYVYDADGYGGTIKGQSGIGNDSPEKGYRGFSNLGVILGTDLTGIIVKTNLNITENANLNLIVTGNSAGIKLPIESNLQLTGFGNGSINGATVLNKGLSFSDARAFYLNNKLCVWLKPTSDYSNFNFEIQTSSQQTQIVETSVGALPVGRTNEVVFTSFSTAQKSDVDAKQNLVTLTTTGSGPATFNQATGSLNIPTPSSGGVVTSLTTTGTSGASTLVSGVLNIPTYVATDFYPLETEFEGQGLSSDKFRLKAAGVSVAKGGTGVGTLTGIVKGNGTAAFSAAVAGTDYLTPTGSAAGLTAFPTFNQNTTGSAASLTTSRNLWGLAFNGTANVTGKPVFTAGTTSAASINIPQGVAPTTPVNGDIWNTSAVQQHRINGVTKTVAYTTDIPATPTLQQVLTAGNTATLGATFGSSILSGSSANDVMIKMDVLNLTPSIQSSNFAMNGVKNLAINPSSGNVLVGTFTDNTVDKLQVNGSISATNLTAGTYTPTGTITDVSGTVTSITPLLTHYSRIGNQVNVSGAVTFNTTTTSTSVTIELTLPIASNMTGGDDAWGTGTVPIPITNYSANSGVTANPTTDKAKLILNTLSGTFTLYYQYMYTIK